MTGVSWFDTLKFSVDWVNVTVQCQDVHTLIRKLCKKCCLERSEWQFVPDGGLHWYKHKMVYTLAGKASITLSYNLDEWGLVPLKGDAQQNGILVSISGDGCRYLDTHHLEGGLRRFLCVLNEYDCNCTRLDAAMDIFDKDNPIVPLFTEFALRAYDFEPDGHLMIKGNMNRVNGYVRYMPVYDPDVSAFTSNVYIGDRTSSKGHCCVYNKKVEVLTGRHKKRADQMLADAGVTDYWYRVEYRAKNYKLANTCFQKLVSENSSAMDAFYYLADNMFTFVDLSEKMNNISRCEVNVVWINFLGWVKEHLKNAHFVQLTAQRYINTSVDDTVRWMERMTVLLAKIKCISDRDPDLYSRLCKDGIERLRTRSEHRQFAAEIFGYEQTVIADLDAV